MEAPILEKTETTVEDTEAVFKTEEIPTETVEVEARTFNSREIFDLDLLEAFRDKQIVVFNKVNSQKLAEGLSKIDASDQACAAVDQTVVEFLQAYGLTETDDSYDAYKQALLELTIIAAPVSDWYAKAGEPSAENGDKTVLAQSGRDKARQTFENLTGEPYYLPSAVTIEDSTPETVDADTEVTPELIPANPDSPELIKAKEKLKELRDTLAALAAKRTGTMAGNPAKYQEAFEKYTEQRNLVGRMVIAEKAHNPELDANTAKLVIFHDFIKQEQNDLRDATTEKLAGTKAHKFMMAVGEWMNTGSKKKQFGKKFLVGAGIGAVSSLALGAGVAVGAGALGVAVTAGGIGGLRLAKAYAVKRAKDGKGFGSVSDTEQDAAIDNVTDEPVMFDTPKTDTERMQEAYDQQFEQKIEAEQSKKRKAFAIAAGSVAAGFVLGAAGRYAAENVEWDQTGTWLKGLFGNHTPETPQANISNLDTPDVADVQTEVPEVEQPSIDAAPVVEAFDPAFVVDSGEGGIHFFQDMGLTQDNWYSVHHELLANFPQDFYPMDNGEVGLQHSGQMSLAAQQFIKERFGRA